VALVPQLVDALGCPVVASGGIADGRGVAAALVLGAGAAQMGTAFVVAEESGAHPGYKRAVREARDDGTAITRAFSGRPARGVRNRFVRDLAAHEAELPPYPIQNSLTRGLRAAAARENRTDLLSLWAGQAAALSRPAPAAEILAGAAEQARRLLGG
jgi:nitronate monooxygenase